jgi:hypothetical protein
MSNSLRRRLHADDGFSMILVLGIALVLTAVAVLAAGKGVAAMRGSGTHALFGQNLDVAEAGIEQLGARVQATNGSYVYCPTTATVSGAVPVQARISGFASKADERLWAATTLRQLAATNPGLLVNARGGQYLAIKPAGLNTIYSMSWVPNFAKAARQRLLKSEYVFSTFRTSAALLANGDVSCCASYDFDLAGGMAPTSAIPIHTNGSLTGSVSAKSGVLQATASGGCSSPCAGGKPNITVPKIDPREFYWSQAWRYADNWYDLCPDGSVRKPNLTVDATPCAPGTEVLTASASNGQRFRGWARSGSSWNNSGGNYPGVYYVYRGNVDQTSQSGGSVSTWSGAMTIITEATANRSCPKTDGYQSYKAVDWLNGGYIPGVMVVSGWYWYQDTNSHLSSGAVLAQGYVEQHTSSAAGLSGQIIAENLCGGTNKLQGSVLAYNGGSDLPLNQVVRNTLELELN